MLTMNNLDHAEAYGSKASHRYKTVTDALAAIDPNNEVDKGEREHFLYGFYREKAVMAALSIRVDVDTKSLPLEQLVKTSVELEEIALRLRQVTK